MASRDLTQGSIPKHLAALALPVVGAMLLQSVYAIVDLAWIKGLGEQAVAGLSINLQVFFIILALSQVVATTALADISQLWGRGEHEPARSAFASFSLVAVGIGLLAAGLAWLSAESYIALFTDDPQVAALGLAYFHVNALTFFSQIVLIVLGYGLRASGDFVSPVAVMVVSVLTNLILDPLLIYGVGSWQGMGIVGAAWATVTGQVLALLLYAALLIRASRDPKKISFGAPHFSLHFFEQLLVRGLPAGAQYLLMSLMLAIVLVAMKPFGAIYTATAGGGFRILQQSILPVVALSSAAAAMAGQNQGAGLYSRVRATSRTVLLWSLIYTSVVALLFVLVPQSFASLFAQPKELQAASTYFVWSWPMVLAFALSLPPTMILQALKLPWLPLSASILRTIALALLVWFWLIPTQAPPTWVFGVSAGSAVLEGLVGLGLLIWRMRSLPADSHVPSPQTVG